MHHIRRHILKILSGTKYARFRDMRPPNADSNVYSYHLRTLQSDGYVAKTAEGYTLATKGLQYVDGLRAEDYRPLEWPKIIVILALRNTQGKWLMAERKIQPYIGTVMFPSGTQRRGESPLQGFERKLLEITGLTDVPGTFRGQADIQIRDTAGELLTHVAANVYEAVLPPSVLGAETDRFRYVWSNFGEGRTKTMAGNAQLHAALEQPGVFNICITGEHAA